jgi:hypothetical protein
MDCKPAAGGIATISNFTCVFSSVVTYALGFAGVVLFILLIVGGFKFITSGGDPKAVDSAKKTLTYAIAGLVVILLSFLVLVLIQTLTGVNVTNFTVVQSPQP